MDQTLRRAEGQRVRYIRHWRSVDVHQPSASSLMQLSGALLLMSLALAALALIVLAALPLLVLGALAWIARPWLRVPRIGSRKVATARLRPARPGDPSGGPTTRPLAHDARRLQRHGLRQARSRLPVAADTQ